MKIKPSTPLLPEISQFDVDFIIPRLGVDLPLGIDPFLLFKSRDANLVHLHGLMIDVFNHAIKLINDKNIDAAYALFDFPEVAEIGLGYTQQSKRGSGLGQHLSSLIVETLAETPQLRERGIHHIEEMQLVSVGIGADRVSDIAGNLLKDFLIDYTQKQCRMWDIPLTKDIPISHVFDFETRSWYDGYFDLPQSHLNNTPMLFVPRRVVRALPWINYDDFYKMEFSAYLRTKRVRAQLRNTAEGYQKQSTEIQKKDVIQLTRSEIERVERYVRAKEEDAAAAQPSTVYLEENAICPETERLKVKMRKIESGTSDAALYQRSVLEILNFLFNPELINGELEVRTIEGTERRDIIFTNDSDKPFWSYLRTEHSSIILMFETKNKKEIGFDDINQVASYLGDRIGRLGIIVTRNPTDKADQRKIYSIYNDTNPRKIILVLSDQDLITMLDMKCAGKDPMRHIQEVYRAFRTSVQ